MSILKSIGHWFGCQWEREWCEMVKVRDAGRLTDRFICVERCRVCGKRRAFYSFHDMDSSLYSVDLDHLIAVSEGRVPYEMITHKKITPDSK